MLEEKMIGYFRYSINVIERAILQVFMPNWLRSIVFKCFMRKRRNRMISFKYLISRLKDVKIKDIVSVFPMIAAGAASVF